ncbi:MAG: hypothetical protein PW792_15910 [Acidobacteriaceae bacterium]|nr:hypothetical protein [Acidobacteriaceae bacterium]
MSNDLKNGTIVRGTDQDFASGEAGARAGRSAGAAAFRLDIRRAYAMHRKAAWVAGLSVFLLVLAYGVSRPKKYEAEAVFYVAPVQRDVLNTNNTQGYDDAKYNATLQQLMQTMQRVDVAETAVKTLPEGVWRGKKEPVRLAAIRLISGLTVQRAGSSFQLVADLQGDDAEGTAAALNALSKAFIEQVKTEAAGPIDQQLVLLNSEKDSVTDALVKARAQQAQLSSALGVARLNTDASNPFDENVNLIRQQIYSLQQSRQMQGGGYGEQSGGGAVSSTGNLVNSLSSRKAQLQSQMAGMTPANPIYQQDQAELAVTEKSLSNASERLEQENNERDSRRQRASDERAKSLEAALKAQMERQSATAAAAAPQLQQYAALTSEIDRLQVRSNAIDESERTIELERRSPSQVRVAVPASTPPGPVPGKRKLITAASFPLGLLAGAIVALLAHTRDRRIFLSRDIEQILGFRPMAVLPVATEVSEPVHNSYLLRLAAAIENSYRNGGARTFVFTAPNPETDVEDLVFHLQLKMKDLGYSALWIDSETLLRAEKDFEEAYGRGPSMDEDTRYSEKGTDGYAAARLAWLQRDYDLVLIDAPALTISGEAEYAVRRCDATVLVNESGVTTRDDLQLAGEILERIGLGGVGAVVKDLKLENADVIFQNAVRKAEADHARRVPREPRDNEGSWQVLEAGTTRELVLPGDPVARSRRRKRPENAAYPRFTQTR